MAEPTVRRRHTGRAIIILLLVLVLVAGGIAAAYLFNVSRTYESQTTFVDLDRSPAASSSSSSSSSSSPSSAAGSESAPERDTAARGANYLVLGTDKRDKEEDLPGQRSDVMMLVHVNQAKDEAYVASFPRDLFIDIPGHGKGRINSALAYGGVPLTVQTVEQYTGVPIDHVAMIDFDGIEQVVDSLGGVTVDVPEGFSQGGFTFTEGSQQMTGEEALVFVRERKSLSQGDFSRNASQRALLQGIVEKILSADTLSSPTKISALVNKTSPYLTVDSGLNTTGMVELGLSLRNLRGANITYLQAPHGDPFMTDAGASVVAPDEDGMDELRTALAEDSMDEYVAAHEAD